MPLSSKAKSPSGESELLEQLRTLRLENEILRQIVNVNGLQNPFQSRGSAQQTTQDEQLQTRPRTVGSAKKVNPGCNCKGNCSTRNCGCVKKNASCTEFCKCGEELCANQNRNKVDADKENTAEPEQQRSAASLAKRVGKAAKSRNIFSPTVENRKNNRERQLVNTLSLRFGEDSENEDSNDSELVSETKGNKKLAKLKSNGKNVGTSKTRGRSRMQQIDVPEEPKQLRSRSNEEIAMDEEVKRKRSASMGAQTVEAATRDESAKSIAGQLEPQKKPTQRNKGKRAGARIPNDKTTENETGEGKQITENENIAETRTSKRTGKNRKQKNEKAKLEKKTGENDRENVVEDIVNNPNVTIDNFTPTNNSHNPEDSEKTQHSQDAKPSSSNSSLPNSLSPPSNNISWDETMEEFNPMKPRRQLSRSPAGQQIQSRYAPLLDVSERPLPVPIPERPIAQLPPPEEINEPVVDWKEHQAKLIRCRKCGRGFYPHRIAVHEQSCKNL